MRVLNFKEIHGPKHTFDKWDFHALVDKFAN